MPVEIRELIIKPTVPESVSTGNATGSALPANSEEREALINEVVERVLKILRNERERNSNLPDSFR